MIDRASINRMLIKKLRLKVALPVLFLLILVGCACENPMTEETFVATNITWTGTIVTNAETRFFEQTNFVFSNQSNAIIHYTTNINSFTNLLFSPTFLSNNLSNASLSSNVMGLVSTNYSAVTNIQENNSSSYILIETNAEFKYSNNEGVVFVTNAVTNVEVSSNTVTNTDWRNWDFMGANLSYLILRNYNLSNANLQNANLQNANLSNANLQNADISGSILLGANTNGIDFTGADLTAALIDLDKELASDGSVGDQFGISVSVSGDTAIVGANFDDDNGDDSGSAYIFTRAGSNWSQSAKIKPSDGVTGEQFGYSVSVSGDTVIVGAWEDNDNGSDSGSAYIFTRTGSTWSEQAKIKPSDGSMDDQFGISVSVSGDTAIVGANGDDDNGTDSGSAYVFTRTGSNWSQQAKIKPSDGSVGDQFGISVSVSGDTAIVGANFDDDNGEASGSAYIFTRSGSTWSQQAKLTHGDGDADDWFGYSVSVSEAEDTVIVGAFRDDDNGESSGSAYIFTRTGSNWSQQAKIKPSDGAEFDNFGRSVSVSGETVIVGSYFDDDNGIDSGSAYVFEFLELP